MSKSQVGLVGLAVMGQNLALNIAEKGFRISVWNRTASKVDETVERAKKEGNLPLVGFHELKDFFDSLERPRRVIILIKAGAPVDEAIQHFLPFMDPEDLLVDGGNEWYLNSERRTKELESKGFRYMAMGVSGGEEGARHGPSLMPGGTRTGYEHMEKVLQAIAAKTEDGPCVTYIGPRGSGNYVKMVHNGIEYGDMQLISEAYWMLKQLGGLSNADLANTFDQWNKAELQSFLIEITAQIFRREDDQGIHDGQLLDVILDVAGSKGTGMWTVQEAAQRGVPIPTIAAALDSRYISGFKHERKAAAQVFPRAETNAPKVSVDDVRRALYASKICSYAQGLHLLRVVSKEEKWDLNLGELARIWKGGCIIRAVFLDRIKNAFNRNADLTNMLVDPDFAAELRNCEESWRRVVGLAVQSGVPVPALAASLNYFDAYRSERLPLNLVQAQRDFFGAHTYERTDRPGIFHTQWQL